MCLIAFEIFSAHLCMSMERLFKNCIFTFYNRLKSRKNCNIANKNAAAAAAAPLFYKKIEYQTNCSFILNFDCDLTCHCVSV